MYPHQCPSLHAIQSGTMDRRDTTEEYAEGSALYTDATWLQIFLKVFSQHASFKAVDRRVLWGVDGLLGASFVLAFWGFIMGLVRCWADGLW